MHPILDSFDRSFGKLDADSRSLLNKLAIADLYRKPRAIPNYMGMFSSGEYLLRSAAMVEKAFGGITTRLWDDPYEWTLPERMSTKELITEYMDEVEATRARGFMLLKSDADLSKEIPSPEKIRPIAEVLLETLSMAQHFQGRAYAVMQMLSDEKLPRI